MRAGSGWILRHPAAALSVLVVLALVGLALGPRLPLEREPAVPGTALIVDARLPGIDAAEVEHLVVVPLEESFFAMTRARQILARSLEGRATIEIRFASGGERERSLETVRERIADLMPQLPRGMDLPVVERGDPPPRAAAVYAVTAESMSADVVKWVEQSLRRPLHELAETSSVTVEGAETAEILIQPDQRRLATLGLSFEDVIKALQRADIAPLRRGARRLATAVPASAEAIAARAVHLPSGESIALAEIAEVSVVRRAAADVPRHNRGPALLLRVYPKSARDAADAADRTDAHLAWLRANGQVPASVAVRKLFDEADETQRWFRRVLKRVGVALAVSLVVVFAFLGAQRTTMLLAANVVWIPLCAAAMWLAGMSLNVMSVAGMMLAGLTLVLAVGWIGAAPLVGALALVSTIVLWWGPARLDAYAQSLAAFSIATFLAVAIAWLLSAWTPQSGDMGSALVRRLPPRLRGRATLGLVVMLILGGALTAAVRALPAAVTVVTGGTAVVRVSGPDEVQLVTLTDNLAATLRVLPGVSAVSRLPVREDVWRLRLDEALLNEQGIGIVEVGRTFAIARNGLVVGELVDADAQLPLRVQLAPGQAGFAFERLLLRGERPDQRALYLRDVGAVERVNAWSERIHAQRMPAAEVRFRWGGEQMPDGIGNLRNAIALPNDYAMSVELTPTVADPRRVAP